MTHSVKQLTHARRGYSLAELLLALTITITIFSAAIPFFALQLRSLAVDLGRTDAQMTARYAQNTVDRELRNIGIATGPILNGMGIPRPQPKIIQADRFAVTFNTDLVAADTIDIRAVYIDPNVDSTLTRALYLSDAITLPLATKSYPDYTYRNSDGSVSFAETVSYWASVDSTSTKTDEYVLFRRVNDGPISVVARAIQIPAGQSLFNYTRIDSAAKIVTVLNSKLPVFWDQANSWSDSIRTVTVNVKGIFHGRNLRNDTTTIVRSISSQTNLANIGLNQLGNCGDIPLNPGVPVATMVTVAGATDHVTLTWARSNDEATGEKDVERYVLYRRVVGNLFDEPYAVVGKGSLTYTFDDFDVQTMTPGIVLEYGVSAQDCSPANSTILVSGTILIP